MFLVAFASVSRAALLLVRVVRWPCVLGGLFVLTIAQASEQTAFITIEGDLKSAAWWVIADFHPFTTEVRGIPVNQIRKSRCKATEFRKDLIPKELLVEGGVDAMEASKLSFALEGHFDGSANAQIAVVGVYQECSGHVWTAPWQELSDVLQHWSGAVTCPAC